MTMKSEKDTIIEDIMPVVRADYDPNLYVYESEHGYPDGSRVDRRISGGMISGAILFECKRLGSPEIHKNPHQIIDYLTLDELARFGFFTDGEYCRVFQKLLNGKIVEIYNGVFESPRKIILENKKKEYPPKFLAGNPNDLAPTLRRQHIDGYDKDKDGECFEYDYSTITPQILSRQFGQTSVDLSKDLNQHFTPYVLSRLVYDVFGGIEEIGAFYDPCGGACSMLTPAIENKENTVYWGDIDRGMEIYPDILSNAGFNIQKLSSKVNPQEREKMKLDWNRSSATKKRDEIEDHWDARIPYEFRESNVCLLTNPPFGTGYVQGPVSDGLSVEYLPDGRAVVNGGAIFDVPPTKEKKVSKKNHPQLDVDIIVQQMRSENVKYTGAIISGGHVARLLYMLEKHIGSCDVVVMQHYESKFFTSVETRIATVWIKKTSNDGMNVYYYNNKSPINRTTSIPEQNDMVGCVDPYHTLVDEIRDVFIHGTCGENFRTIKKAKSVLNVVSTKKYFKNGDLVYYFDSRSGKKVIQKPIDKSGYYKVLPAGTVGHNVMCNKLGPYEHDTILNYMDNDTREYVKRNEEIFIYLFGGRYSAVGRDEKYTLPWMQLSDDE